MSTHRNDPGAERRTPGEERKTPEEFRDRGQLLTDEVGSEGGSPGDLRLDITDETIVGSEATETARDGGKRPPV